MQVLPFLFFACFNVAMGQDSLSWLDVAKTSDRFVCAVTGQEVFKKHIRIDRGQSTKFCIKTNTFSVVGLDQNCEGKVSKYFFYYNIEFEAWHFEGFHVTVNPDSAIQTSSRQLRRWLRPYKKMFQGGGQSYLHNLSEILKQRGWKREEVDISLAETSSIVTWDIRKPRTSDTTMVLIIDAKTGRVIKDSLQWSQY